MLVDPHFSPATEGGFIVFEGVNGAGKSTLVRAIETKLRSHGYNPLVTREPGGTELGQRIRGFFTDPNRPFSIVPLAESLLFAADRAQHVEEIIKPALKQRRPVLCDRYFYSTLAFQGYGRGIDLAQLRLLSEYAINGLVPDLVVLLDLPIEVAMRRIKKRDAEQSLVAGSDSDSFELEAREFHERVRQGFLELAKSEPVPFLVINADQDRADIISTIQLIIDKFIP